MSGSPFDADAYARQAAEILGIPLSDAQRPGVVANLTRTAELARFRAAGRAPAGADLSAMSTA